MLTKTGIPADISPANVTAETIASEPVPSETKLPEIVTKVIPTAAMPMIDAPWRMAVKLVGLRKPGTAKLAIAPIIASRASSAGM